MLRSQTVLTIHDLYTQGKTVQEIAQEVGHSRTTVRKYLKHPEAVIPKPRPPRPSKLDPFKEQITKWAMEDHCTNCEVLFERLQKLGYTGGISILKEYVHPLRPAVAGHAPVQRYETRTRENRSNLIGASVCTSRREKRINSMDLSPSSAIRACAS
jgi:transposase